MSQPGDWSSRTAVERCRLQLGLDVVGDQLIRIVVGPKACQATLQARQDREVVGGSPMFREGGGEPSEALVVVGQHQHVGCESVQGGRGPAVVTVFGRLLGVLLVLLSVLADAAVQPLLEIEGGDNPSLLSARANGMLMSSPRRPPQGRAARLGRPRARRPAISSGTQMRYPKGHAVWQQAFWVVEPC
jgi:hypothetical protein